MTWQHDPEIAVALDLVARAYEAAAEPHLWPQFLNALADATDCDGTVIWLHDARDETALLRVAGASFVSNIRIEPEHLKTYAEYYTHRNVLLKRISEWAEGTVVDSANVIPEIELRKSEFYNGWMRPQGVGYCLGGPVLKRGSTVAMLSLSRPERHGPFGERDLQLARMLMPHLRRACLLHQRLTSLRAERSGALAALELLPTAVWLLDAEGRLLLANLAGRELDAHRDGIWIERDGRPTAADPDERLALQRCIARAIAAGQGCGLDSDGALRIRRTQTAEPLHAMVYPLARDALLTGGAAAVFIFDPARTNVPNIELLKVFYGLTPAEARLACALAQGSTVAEYSATHRLTSNTVRTHLKRALAKTGVHQQSQLVRLVANLPSMMPPHG